MKKRTIVGLLLMCCAWGAAPHAAQRGTATCDRECLRGFRQDIIDERAGVAGAHVVVEESGAPVLLVVRLKVVADRLTEVELVSTRGRAEGLIFNIDGLRAPSAVMNYAPRPEQLATREEAIKAAMHYPEGLNAAKTFAAVNAPFAPDAYRFENGQVMAGPACTFAPGCQNISTQSLAIFERLGDVQTRVVAVDERMGMRILPVEKRNGGWE